MIDAAELVWGQALAALRAIFPLVGVVFLVRLVAVCRALFSDLTDSELAHAVGVAFGQTMGRQKYEGLFLRTVPEAIAAVRAGRIGGPPGPPPSPSPGLAAGARTLLSGCAEVLRARGAPLDALAAACDSLRAEITDAPEDLEAVEAKMVALEGRILKSAAAVLSPEQRAALQASLDHSVKPYQRRMSRDQLANLETQFRERETLSILQIPRLSLFYV